MIRCGDKQRREKAGNRCERKRPGGKGKGLVAGLAKLQLPCQVG